jgi:AmiR/NasT family two-component response regulator
MDVAGGGLLYDGSMKRAYLADAQTEERSALRLMLLHLNLQVVGEAADWPTTLAQAPATRPDMVVVDWDLVGMEDHFCALCWDEVTFLDQDDEDSV